MLKSYQITAEVTSFNRATEKERVFAVNETVKATPVTDANGNVTGIDVEGFIIPIEYVKAAANKALWIFAGLGVAFLIIAFIVYNKYKK